MGTTDVGNLALHRFLFRSALSLGNIFAWIIVFRIFFVNTRDLETALAGVTALFVLSHSLTFFLTPLAGMALRRGVRTLLMFGTVLAALSFLLIALLFLAHPSPDEMFWSVAAFAIMQGVWRAFYFLPYKSSEGTHAQPLPLLGEAFIAFLPALAGYILSTHSDGPVLLFSLCLAFVLISLVFIVRMRESYEPYEWTYGETVRELFARKNHLAVGLFILDGVQGAVLLFIWPLAVFLLLSSFQSLGAVLTATLCVAFLGRYLVKKILRAFRVRSPMVFATIVFSTWIAKLAAASPVQILTVNIAYTSGTSPVRFSIDTYAHEQVADGGHFIDEYTAIKEMGLSIGRIAVCLLFIFLLLTTSESLAFVAAIVTAAVTAAWSVFLAHRLQKAIY